ncbi:type II CRISPR RNA-guided endonuclease Cas9 [Arcanobacterium buesumense]|uniref:HNH endonuclease n=1 Tax=Arcanobacterium buesumense TaxID=2722751 RepID=A0A6H2ENB6_9ACTO|nr:type II CRISPR RNA-guided endonuclease Cas9 [Arcanobacterium buesumense]QJC22566.1 HNH endonuclease [Arcanobacterium buesumense]
MSDVINFRVGIDVGTNSVGLAAIEIGPDNLPSKILNSVVFTHDGGVDPQNRKTAATRLAVSGVARRTRRLIRRRKQRLRALDVFLQSHGYPCPNLEEFDDPHFPWHARAQLVSEPVAQEELPELFSVAIRHIARHRGWRNPYSRVESLHLPTPPSEELNNLKNRLIEETGVVLDEDATPAEIITEVISDMRKIRGPEGILGGKLRQSDNANEIRKIGEVQGLDSSFINDVIDHVFAAESPKGSSAKRAGKDELPGQHDKFRAEKAHPAFQEFRIVSVVANLRIKDLETGSIRKLTRDEMDTVVTYLMNASAEDSVTWDDVATKLEISRDCLSGTASPGPDGDRPYLIPPTNTTNQRILESKLKPLIAFWKNADLDTRSTLINEMSNSSEITDDSPGAEEVHDFLTSLADTELEKLSTISLPAGRAAYSVDSLQRLSRRMLNDGVDLFTARKLEFDVPDDWRPSAAPIGDPVGNPGVDRVLKIVNRWLMNVTDKWGVPATVNIEHIRGGFGSEAMAREYEREVGQRFKRNQMIIAKIQKDNDISGPVRSADITRYLAVKRQNGACAYCGTTISLGTCEMDHIVPRKGQGSTNSRSNLLATCRSCNHSKGNRLFNLWAKEQNNPNISFEKAKDRITFWIKDDGLSPKQWNQFKRDIIMRLGRVTEDDELDSRSIESVAWMARELRHRIESHYLSTGSDTKVNVFKGMITSEARKASGFEMQVEMIGDRGKTRLDRRHHAMDACTIALMSPYVAQVLAERINLREYQQLTRERFTWKEYRGKDETHRISYGKWLNSMNRLLVLFNEALRSDSIPIMEDLRLRLGNGTAHDATIHKFGKKRLGDAWSFEDIDKASTPQMWLALTRCSDFDQKDGLPENPERTIRVKDVYYTADDELELFRTKAALLSVRGGYAEIGNTIHHARIYRINGKKISYAMVRVFAVDLHKHRHEDLFNVVLPPESISIRTAAPKIKQALADGTAEYLGWVVAGDEIEIIPSDPKAFAKGAIGELFEDFPGLTRFKLVGFDSPSKLRLRPVKLSSEGLNDNFTSGSHDIIAKAGWRPEINVVFSKAQVRVIRRTTLGNIRNTSSSHLPSSWQV